MLELNIQFTFLKLIKFHTYKSLCLLIVSIYLIIHLTYRGY